jgi:uncharacterized membrane protein
MAEKPDHRLDRLVFFSDAVFAIAITLLVLDLHRPELGMHSTTAEWLAALNHETPHYMSFLLSFLVIGAIWVVHHRVFAMVRHFDPRLVWPSLLLLLSVVFLPFATTLLATGTTSPVPFALYCGALLFAAAMKARLTSLALRPALVAPGVPPRQVAVELRRMWLMPAAAALALALAFVAPGTNMMALFILPVMMRLPYFGDA